VKRVPRRRLARSDEEMDDIKWLPLLRTSRRNGAETVIAASTTQYRPLLINQQRFYSLWESQAPEILSVRHDWRTMVPILCAFESNANLRTGSALAVDASVTEGTPGGCSPSSPAPGINILVHFDFDLREQ
jgi:hypothetical protein